MGGEGSRRAVVTSVRGFASREPFAFRFALPSVSDAELSTSLRSLLSASASSSTSLGTEMSLCESSGPSVATDLFSSSSRRLRRARPVCLFLMPAMLGGAGGLGRCVESAGVEGGGGMGELTRRRKKEPEGGV